MKIIFLDVDGVLNCDQTWEGPWADGTDTLDPVLCDNFARIVSECKPDKIVLSSTWRLFRHAKGDKSWWKLNNWLNERGVIIHDVTPDLSLESEGIFVIRGEEIRRWLQTSGYSDARILILDDDNDFLEEQRPFHIQTSFKDGLTTDLADAAIAVLNAQ